MNAEDAKGHWLRVVKVGEIHVLRGIQVILEVFVPKRKVDRRHSVVVSIVAVARPGIGHAWIGEV